MDSVLYLNNVYYTTVEIGSPVPVIYWSVPSVSRNNRYRVLGGFDPTDFLVIEFRHCGLGHYHCHVSVEEEERIRNVKIGPQNF